jgi:hypothetical protein
MHMISSFLRGRLWQLTLDHRGHAEGDSEVPRRDHDGLSGGVIGACTLGGSYVRVVNHRTHMARTQRLTISTIPIRNSESL